MSAISSISDECSSELRWSHRRRVCSWKQWIADLMRLIPALESIAFGSIPCVARVVQRLLRNPFRAWCQPIVARPSRDSTISGCRCCGYCDIDGEKGVSLPCDQCWMPSKSRYLTGSISSVQRSFLSCSRLEGRIVSGHCKKWAGVSVWKRQHGHSLSSSVWIDASRWRRIPSGKRSWMNLMC